MPDAAMGAVMPLGVHAVELAHAGAVKGLAVMHLLYCKTPAFSLDAFKGCATKALAQMA